MKLTAIAIDDEPHALEVLQLLAGKVPFLNLESCFTDAFEAVWFLQENRVDLIFVDIKMPDITGIEFVRCLKQVPMTIFTTAYSDYALQGFELEAIDYLLKPFSLARFTKACNKALENKCLRHQQADDFIFVKTGYEEEKVRMSEILYVEAEGNYLTLFLKSRQLLTRQTMGDMLQVLPASQFVRVHRSYIVSVNNIDKISRQKIIVAGKSLPVGASYEEKVQVIRAQFFS
jgi:two-component system, LytTR family, response regulator